MLPLLFLGAFAGKLEGQAKQGAVGSGNGLFDDQTCVGKSATCFGVLRRALNTKKVKSGDHFTISTLLITKLGEEPTTGLEATIIAVRLGAKNETTLRVRIDEAVRKDGATVPIEGRIVAVVSKSSIREGWRYPPAIIADRYPRIPEDDVRLPGERKYSDERQTSPLDSAAATYVPDHYTKACTENRQNGPVNVCSDLLKAQGVYGFQDLVLGLANPALPGESVLTSVKSIRLPKGTTLVIEVRR